MKRDAWQESDLWWKPEHREAAGWELGYKDPNLPLFLTFSLLLVLPIGKSKSEVIHAVNTGWPPRAQRR